MGRYQVTTPDRTVEFNSKRHVTHAAAMLHKVNDPNNQEWTIMGMTDKPERAEKLVAKHRRAGTEAMVVEIQKIG